jgi:hypothetical protein
MTNNGRLRYIRTRRFGVLDSRLPPPPSPEAATTTVGCRGVDLLKTPLPVLELSNVLLHAQRHRTDQVRSQFDEFLRTHGFVFLTAPQSSQPGRIIRDLRDTVHHDLFPNQLEKNDELPTSQNIYWSEKNIPMYRLGYEFCEDGMREVFRVAAGRVDDQPWPDAGGRARSTTLRALGLVRHVCDTILDLLLSGQQTKIPIEAGAKSKDMAVRKPRPGSGSSTWWSPHGQSPSYTKQLVGTIPDRDEDYSVWYSMHYFNTTPLRGETIVTLKAHVDPSLLVVEPFLCPYTRGLQVWNRTTGTWMDVDGPASPVSSLWETGQEVMLLFGGKALGAACNLEPTLHRVVLGSEPRSTVIYEQKYGELFPPPISD